jgi:two-component system response regulator HydG
VLGLSHDAAHRLKEYDWPGNVRELENCIESAVAMSTSDELGLEDLPERIRRFRADDFTVQTTDPAELPSLAEMERRYIFRVLKSVGGNKSAAAKVLGFDRRTLYRKLDGYGAEEPR